MHHPIVGELELEYEVMRISADSGLRLAVFSAEPGMRSAEALDLLAELGRDAKHGRLEGSTAIRS